MIPEWTKHAWQTWEDSTPYYTNSEEIEHACDPPPDGFVPAGPWEPLGRGEWRRPLVREEP